MASPQATTDVDLSLDRCLQDFIPPSMKDSDSSSSTLSTSDIFSEKCRVKNSMKKKKKKKKTF